MKKAVLAASSFLFSFPFLQMGRLKKGMLFMCFKTYRTKYREVMTITLFILITLIVAKASAQDLRGASTSNLQSLSDGKLPIFKNIALVIGTDHYDASTDWKQLSNPVYDAQVIAERLSKDYGYEVKLMIDPIGDSIFSALGQYAKYFKLHGSDENVNLLIFIAGHGGSEIELGGFIVPKDAKPKSKDPDRRSCISHNEFLGRIRAINAKHKLVVLDVCYGGTFIPKFNHSATRGGLDDEQIGYKELVTDYLPLKSSICLASVGNKSAYDGNPGDHSPFAKRLINALVENYDNKEIVTLTKLVGSVEDLNPRYGGFDEDFDLGNNFILIPNSIHEQPKIKTAGSAPVNIVNESQPIIRNTSIKTIAKVKSQDYKVLPTSIDKENSKWPEMVTVKGGTFVMGSNESSNERPIHSVTIGTFNMSKYEITVADFRKFMNSKTYLTDADKEGKSYVFDGRFHEKSGVNWECDIAGNKYSIGFDIQPVVHISWNDAVAYCKWLSFQTKKNYRLPTEAEWEYATNGEGGEKGGKFSGGDDIEAVGWYSKNSGGTIHSVGQKIPNTLGIYDITGNVWEWCSDWFCYDYYSKSPGNNPKGCVSGTEKVVRGGGFDDPEAKCRTTYRNHISPDHHFYYCGFRVVSQ